LRPRAEVSSAAILAPENRASGRDENRSGGFERGGWARPLFDDEAMTFVEQVYQVRVLGAVLGRDLRFGALSDEEARSEMSDHPLRRAPCAADHLKCSHAARR
jgi:hypothetical protein